MRIYLDHNAGARLRSEVRDAMVAALGPLTNPSSAHREGARARSALEAARAEVAALVGARPAEIVFTSGATEANNMALRGTSGGIVTTAIEHASVLETARHLATADRSLSVIPVDGEGCVALDDVLAAVGEVTRIASIGLANGEVGSIAPVAAIARALRPRGIRIHTDAAQAAAWLPIDVGTLDVDFVSLSAHKIGGPAGVGALWVRADVRLAAQLTGGPQERGRRAGTENVAGIVGFGEAARLARRERAGASRTVGVLRDRLWDGIRARVPGVMRHGPATGEALPNTLSVRFPGCTGESLLVLLDLAGIAVSLGSACAAGSAEPSHVLLAMGLDHEAARSAIRLSLGPSTTAADVDRVVDVLPRLVAQVRGGAAVSLQVREAHR
jgi:cysteine desulfurase